MTRVRTIVGRRDYRALSALMGSDFRVEFDVGQGPAVFARHWHPQSPSSAIWSVLGQIVRQGGALYSQSLYCLPHSVAYFPIDLDLMSNVVALHDSVSLLTKPEAGAAKAGTLRQSIIRLEASLEAPVLLRPGTFLAVRHSELGRCYVDSADVYHPAAHRAFLEKRNGRWRWISLASATLADPPDLLRLLEKRT